jgi:hypothetical protein
VFYDYIHLTYAIIDIQSLCHVQGDLIALRLPTTLVEEDEIEPQTDKKQKNGQSSCQQGEDDHISLCRSRDHMPSLYIESIKKQDSLRRKQGGFGKTRLLD